MLDFREHLQEYFGVATGFPRQWAAIGGLTVFVPALATRSHRHFPRSFDWHCDLPDLQNHFSQEHPSTVDYFEMIGLAILLLLEAAQRFGCDHYYQTRVVPAARQPG